MAFRRNWPYRYRYREIKRDRLLVENRDFFHNLLPNNHNGKRLRIFWRFFFQNAPDPCLIVWCKYILQKVLCLLTAQASYAEMDRRTDGETDRQTDGQTDEWSQ